MPRPGSGWSRWKTAAGAQSIALRDATALAEQRGDLLLEATTKLLAAEDLAGGQRTTLAQLEARLSDQSGSPGRARNERAAADHVPDDEGQLRATLSRLRAEQDYLRKSLTAASGERDRLRLRVDELLLTIEDMQEKTEAVEEQAAAIRHPSQPAGHADRVPQRAPRGS